MSRLATILNKIISNQNDITTYTLTKGQSDINIGQASCCVIGKVCYVTLALQDPTPVAGAAVVKGLPAPKYYQNIGAPSTLNGGGLKLATGSDQLVWDGTTNVWMNIIFSYIVAD